MWASAPVTVANGAACVPLPSVSLPVVDTNSPYSSEITQPSASGLSEPSHVIACIPPLPAVAPALPSPPLPDPLEELPPFPPTSPAVPLPPELPLVLVAPELEPEFKVQSPRLLQSVKLLHDGKATAADAKNAPTRA